MMFQDLRNELKRPFNILTLFLALLGIAAGFYFYHYPRIDKQISYLVAVPAKVFDSKNASPRIHLLDAKNNPVTQDAYLVSATL